MLDRAAATGVFFFLPCSGRGAFFFRNGCDDDRKTALLSRFVGGVWGISFLLMSSGLCRHGSGWAVSFEIGVHGISGIQGFGLLMSACFTQYQEGEGGAGVFGMDGGVREDACVSSGLFWVMYEY